MWVFSLLISSRDIHAAQGPYLRGCGGVQLWAVPPGPHLLGGAALGGVPRTPPAGGAALGGVPRALSAGGGGGAAVGGAPCKL